jgi:predicted nucleic acid-binding protein
MRVVIDTNIIVSGYLGGALETIIVVLKSGKDWGYTLRINHEDNARNQIP